MTRNYKINGMTCTGCQEKVQNLLSKVHGVDHVLIDLNKGEATVEMNRHVPTSDLKEAIRGYPTETVHKPQSINSLVEEEKKTWFETYRPILVVFAYILGVTLLIEFSNAGFLWMRWMYHFMAGFFIVFSFFKLLNLQGFAESYSMYDVVAKKWNRWGYVYAFIELALGVAFLTGFNPIVTNAVTIIVMTVSIVGVLQTVLNKRKIKCACLGAVFNLPMSTITIIEDALMILMSAVMLFYLLI